MPQTTAPKPPSLSDGSLDAERFVQYSPGPEVEEWAGWMEIAGAVTGFVTRDGEIWRPSQPDADGAWRPVSKSGPVSARTVAWNLARTALKRAMRSPHDDAAGNNYYSSSNAAALLGLTLKAMRWQKALPAESRLADNVRYVIENAMLDATAEDLLSAACADRPSEDRFTWTTAAQEPEFPSWLLEAMKKRSREIGSAYYTSGGLVIATRSGSKALDTGDVIVKLAAGDLDVIKAKAIDRGGCLEEWPWSTAR